MEEQTEEVEDVGNVRIDEVAPEKEFIRVKPEDVLDGENVATVKEVQIFTSQKFTDKQGNPKRDAFALCDTARRKDVWVKLGKQSLQRLKRFYKCETLGELVGKKLCLNVLTANIGGKLTDYVLAGGQFLAEERKQKAGGKNGLQPES